MPEDEQNPDYVENPTTPPEVNSPSLNCVAGSESSPVTSSSPAGGSSMGMSGRLSGHLSIPRLRTLVNSVLVVAVLVFTGGVFWLVQGIFDRFGPAVEEDLAWKAVRGAREVAGATDLGILVQDEETVKAAYADYERSKDVQAICVMNDTDVVIAQHNGCDDARKVFEGEPGVIQETDSYFAAYAEAEIETVAVGKVAVIVSKNRLKESAAMLNRVLLATGVASALALVGGLFFVGYFTRAVADRDARLAAYAATLEQKVAERTSALRHRTEEMRLVLDNVEQGFITVDVLGVMGDEKSAIVEQWFGVAEPGATLGSYVGQKDPSYQDWFEFSLDSLKDEILPLDIYLAQMPGDLKMGNQALRVGYRPIMDGEVLRRLMVVMTDVTAQLEAEASEQRLRQDMAVFERVMGDRAGFEDFLSEAQNLVKAICGSERAEPKVEARLVHTLKGNTGLFRIDTIAELCHEIEEHTAEELNGVSEEDRLRLQSAWDEFAERARSMLGTRGGSKVELELMELFELVDGLRTGKSHEDLLALVEPWQFESAQVRLDRMSQQACSMARKMCKPEPEVSVDGGGVRLDSVTWGGFWTCLVHVIRNAVDHGLETAETRQQLGKEGAGQMWLSTRYGTESGFVLEIRDDGAGVDWIKVREKAVSAGLPRSSRQELQDALFSDGLSTRDEADEFSGRGVGMAAVKEETEARGGRIEVDTVAGKGTTFRFVFPDTATPLERPSKRPSLRAG